MCSKDRISYPLVVFTNAVDRAGLDFKRNDGNLDRDYLCLVDMSRVPGLPIAAGWPSGTRSDRQSTSVLLHPLSLKKEKRLCVALSVGSESQPDR